MCSSDLIVAEDYRLVGVTGPNMIVSGSDENHVSLANVDKLDIKAGTEPNSVQVTGQVTFRSPFIFSVSSGSIGTDAAPNLMSPRVPYHSNTGNTPADGANFVVANGTYIINAPAPLAGSEYNTPTAGGDVGGGAARTAPVALAIPDPTTTDTGGTGMTLQVTVSGNAVTGVQVLNPGSGYHFGNVFRIPGSGLTAAGTGFVDIVLNSPDSTLADDTEIVNPGGMFSSNPPGATLSSVSMLDVLTVENAKKMLTAVDGALVRIDLERSDLGATMSRMEHVINNLSNITKNTKEARSRIQDADIAEETTNLTKAQVLNQAAQAMLAQANRTSQSILSLLQG